MNTEAPFSPPESSRVNSFVAEIFDSACPATELQLPDGRLLRLPTALLLEQLVADAPLTVREPNLASDEQVVVPIIEEQLHVGKRNTVTDTVRLDKHVSVYEEALDVPLAIRSYDVERVIFNHPVDAAPPVRQEGDTTIYPLVEEQLILTKQLILREELRVTRRDTERHDTQTVSLRRESIEVTRA